MRKRPIPKLSGEIVLDMRRMRNKRVPLGSYDSLEEAAAARCVAEKKYYGEFATQNT